MKDSFEYWVTEKSFEKIFLTFEFVEDLDEVNDPLTPHPEFYSFALRSIWESKPRFVLSWEERKKKTSKISASEIGKENQRHIIRYLNSRCFTSYAQRNKQQQQQTRQSIYEMNLSNGFHREVFILVDVLLVPFFHSFFPLVSFFFLAPKILFFLLFFHTFVSWERTKSSWVYKEKRHNNSHKIGKRRENNNKISTINSSHPEIFLSFSKLIMHARRQKTTFLK